MCQTLKRMFNNFLIIIINAIMWIEMAISWACWRKIKMALLSIFTWNIYTVVGIQHYYKCYGITNNYVWNVLHNVRETAGSQNVFKKKKFLLFFVLFFLASYYWMKSVCEKRILISCQWFAGMWSSWEWYPAFSMRKECGNIPL